MTLKSLKLGSNIHVMPWAPQNDVLGHPGVKAFVTQAGINSIYEAVYHAKPTVAVPLITEQAESGQRVRSPSSSPPLLQAIAVTASYKEHNDPK